MIISAQDLNRNLARLHERFRANTRPEQFARLDGRPGRTVAPKVEAKEYNVLAQTQLQGATLVRQPRFTEQASKSP
jgi:hypothetical protein